MSRSEQNETKRNAPAQAEASSLTIVLPCKANGYHMPSANENVRYWHDGFRSY
jgi:hypothetical protein